jgi:hypothetical protein
MFFIFFMFSCQIRMTEDLSATVIDRRYNCTAAFNARPGSFAVGKARGSNRASGRGVAAEDYV